MTDNHDQINEEEFEDVSEFKRKRGFSFATRSPLMIIFMIAASIYLMYGLHGELRYFFSPKQAVDFGNAVEFEGTDLPDHSYVKISGLRNPTKGISLNATWDKTNVFPLMGTSKVYVQTRQETDKENSGLSYGTYSGRLYRMGSLHYFDIVKKFALNNFGIDIKPDAILVRDGETPGDNWYYVPIYILLVVVALLNFVLLIKRIKNR